MSCVCFDCFLAKPKLAPAFLFPPPLRRGNPVERVSERGGWFGSLVGLDEGVGKEGEEEFDEGKGRKGWQKNEEEEEDNKHLRWQLSPLPSLSVSVDRPLSSKGDSNARN